MQCISWGLVLTRVGIGCRFETRTKKVSGSCHIVWRALLVLAVCRGRSPYPSAMASEVIAAFQLEFQLFICRLLAAALILFFLFFFTVWLICWHWSYHHVVWSSAAVCYMLCCLILNVRSSKWKSLANIESQLWHIHVKLNVSTCCNRAYTSALCSSSPFPGLKCLY